jgi:sugar/nucleoside kinase (ribokinase family)
VAEIPAVARLDVCVVGEINPDLIVYGVPKDLQPEREALVEGFRLTLGSSSAIFAHNLSALGARVGIVSKIGADSFAKMALGWLTSGGVDVSRVRESSDSTATGLTVILVRKGERAILTYPGTMFDLRYEDLDLDYIFSAQHLHLSSYFLHTALRSRIGELFHLAHSKGLTTSLDTNDDPEGAWADDLQQVLPHVDILFPNEREAKKIARNEDFSAAIAALSEKCGIVAVKLGADGALARKGKREWRCAPLKVDAVDAVGAGDSFDAGFIRRYLQGGSVEDCLKHANLAGAYSTTSEGGTEAFKDRDKLKTFFQQHAGV